MNKTNDTERLDWLSRQCWLELYPPDAAIVYGDGLTPERRATGATIREAIDAAIESEATQ